MTTETMDFTQARKAAEAAGLLGSGDYLKMKEGDNRFRLMSMCLPHAGEFNGKKNFKWLCYVLDRVDGRVKPFFMPHTIYKKIEALQTNDDYAFASVPMPYDLTIHAKGAGTIDVEYSLIPARKETPLKQDEMDQLKAMKPLAELQAALKEKNEQQKAKAPAPQHEDQSDRGPDGADYDDAEVPPFMR